MKLIFLIILIEIIFIGFKYKKGKSLNDITMCFEKCDEESCGPCIDRGQCNLKGEGK